MWYRSARFHLGACVTTTAPAGWEMQILLTPPTAISRTKSPIRVGPADSRAPDPNFGSGTCFRYRASASDASRKLQVPAELSGRPVWKLHA